MIRVVGLSSFDVDPEVREAWDRLADLDPAAAPFRRQAWISMLWSAYEREAEPYLLAVFQDDTLMGVAPWVRAIRHFGRRRISVLSDMAEGAPRSSPWLCDPARSATVGRAILEHLRDHATDWDLILLPGIAEDRLAGIEPVLNDLRASRHIETAGRRRVLFPGGTHWARYLLGLRPDVVASLNRQDRILRDLEITQATGDDLSSELQSRLLVLPWSRAPRTCSELLRVRPDLERLLGSGLRKHIACTTVSLRTEIIAFTLGGGSRAAWRSCSRGSTQGTGRSNWGTMSDGRPWNTVWTPLCTASSLRPIDPSSELSWAGAHGTTGP